ncbi:hypothetical protein HY468_05060, partial [Candidatus Roizmanbacteria bacterium]|nr:hypothetical protein [Candidatus Roizmanbacteria bacterium]
MKRIHTLRIFGMFFFIVTLAGFSLMIQPPKTSAQTSIARNYIQWWPRTATPWLFGSQAGGQVGYLSFLKYNRTQDFTGLRNSFNEMVKKHKPHLLIVMMEWGDIQPLIFSAPNAAILPRDPLTLQQVRSDTLVFDYFDDVVKLAQANNMKVMLYPIISAYGSGKLYPFSYASNTGWFWKRRDWSNGLADPTTDAMRHPSVAQVCTFLARVGVGCDGSGNTPGAWRGYDWIEHQGGYWPTVTTDSTHPNFTHSDFTSDGIELPQPGFYNLQVYESPDMVFNAYDVRLSHATEPNANHTIHSPIPSLSSTAYLNVTKDIFQKIGAHFANSNIFGYFIFQEPTYAHLRENVNYCRYGLGQNGENWENGYTTMHDDLIDDQVFASILNTCIYDVDYSQAELIAYNRWRALPSSPVSSHAPVSQIPFPPDLDYVVFRGYNLANFLNNLKSGLRTGDQNAKIGLSILGDVLPNFPPPGPFDPSVDLRPEGFFGERYNGMGVSPFVLLSVLQPDIQILEHIDTANVVFQGGTDAEPNLNLRQKYINILKTYGAAGKTVISYYQRSNDVVGTDQTFAQHFQ